MDDHYFESFQRVWEQNQESDMNAQDKKYPETIVGLYLNTYAKDFHLKSVPLDQERADQICAVIQKCVGGRLELKKKGGLSKNGKRLPDYFLEGVTKELLAIKQAFADEIKNRENSGNSEDSSL